MPGLLPGVSRFWVLGAVGAIALHAALAATTFIHLNDDDDDDMGAPGLEVAMDLAAPRREETPLPAGPDQDDQPTAPDIAEQKKVVEETSVAQGTPTETQDPDRVVSANPVLKPTEEKQEKAETPTPPQQRSEASQAAALPGSETIKEGPRSTTIAEGSGVSDRKAVQRWDRSVWSQINKNRRFPPDEEEKIKNTLIVSVSISVDRTGHVLSVSVAQSSGNSILDDAAVAAVRKSDPLPAPPVGLTDDGLAFILPVAFNPPKRR